MNYFPYIVLSLPATRYQLIDILFLFLRQNLFTESFKLHSLLIQIFVSVFLSLSPLHLRKELFFGSWIATGIETNNYCTGEGQQQFNQPTEIS
jgi:hypothetical protein